MDSSIQKVFLGLDTSNYTTSAAIVDADGNVLIQQRRLLTVKEGERGLRQSDALWQHQQVLPELLEPLLTAYRGRIAAVGASEKPRPIEGSYMPVFTCGMNTAKLLSAALGVPYIPTDHQNGHFEAAAIGSSIDFNEPVLCCHLSGGTMELIGVKDGCHEILGKTKDISYGQLIDRVGVAMGKQFPAGRYLDEMACSVGSAPKNPLCKVHTDGMDVNLSGLETQAMKAVAQISHKELSYYLLQRIGDSLRTVINKAKETCGFKQVLLSGGVASSQFLRRYLESEAYTFGKAAYCSDNAVGIALITRRKSCL